MGREVFIAQLYWQGLQPATSCLARTSFTYHHTARSFFNWMSNFVGEITLLSRAVDHYRSKTSNEPAKWSSNCNRRSVVDLKHWLNWTRMRLIRVHESRQAEAVEAELNPVWKPCTGAVKKLQIISTSELLESPCRMRTLHNELSFRVESRVKAENLCTRNCQKLKVHRIRVESRARQSALCTHGMYYHFSFLEKIMYYHLCSDFDA